MKTLLEVCKEKGIGFDATFINVSRCKLTSLDGIELFTELKVLYCSHNKLTSLDVSKNPALKELSCSGNKFTSLDLSKNTNLTDLYCHNNQLIALDVSKNTDLRIYYCLNNKHPYTPLFYSLNRIRIGCQENTFEFWDNFFLGDCTIEYATKRGTPKFSALVEMWIEFKKELGL